MKIKVGDLMFDDFSKHLCFVVRRSWGRPSYEVRYLDELNGLVSVVYEDDLRRVLMSFVGPVVIESVS